MQLTSRTDTALKLLLYIDVHHDRRVSAQEIGYALEKPHESVQRIAAVLAKAGLIDSRRGQYGGIKPLRKLRDIFVAEVLALGEAEVGWQFTECDRRPDCNCVMRGNCTLKEMFSALQQQFMALAEQWPLEDLRNDGVIETARQKAAEFLRLKEAGQFEKASPN